jgi:UDP-N-acetylmuramate--alanine ligase
MYKKREHVHFMGIGGIGMSGIAEILKLRGYKVSGCDLGSASKTLDHLQDVGCIVYHGHNVSHIHDADVLVYSSAVKQDDPEIRAALEKGIPVIPRALMLGELMRTKYSVAVSGAHGKTTTTSLISHIMIEADRQPTVIVGGVLKNIANNAKMGGGEVLIAEADESDRSLLNLSPTMAVVTNIDAEHLDTYKDLDDIKNTFKSFLARLPFYGKAFVCIDDEPVRSIFPLPHICAVKYGLSPDADIMGDNVELGVATSSFDVYFNDSIPGSHQKEKKLLGHVNLNIPGKHNVLNALASIGVCLEFEVPFAVIAAALETFKGVERRFEFKGIYKGTEIFDDYGHHPTEIKTTLLVAQKRTQKRLHVVFQPHRFTRTEKLWNEFVEVFAAADKASYAIDTLCITDIYPASEAPIPGITADRLVEAIKKCNPTIRVTYTPTYAHVAQAVEPVIQEGDLLLTIGAGKVNQVGEALVSKNEQ